MMKNLIITILAIVSICSVGYIVYINNNNSDNNNNNYKLEDFTEIIDKELNFLKTKKKLSDLTNEEKTFMIYWHLLGYSNDLTTTKLENARKNSSLREMDVTYTDIYDTYDYYKMHDTIVYSLNKKSGKYTNVFGGHGVESLDTYDFLVDFKRENNKYIVSYRHIFRLRLDPGATIDYNLYYTFEDYLNGKKYTKVVDGDNVYYYKENYKSFKDKLDTYNYVFEVHDGNIVLTDFYRN